MSSLLLRMGKPDEAEAMLARYPSFKDFTDATFIKTSNPRYSGDMILLFRIRLAQNRLGDALRLASKALTFRRNVLGDRMKTCDALYNVANILVETGENRPAIEFLDELVSISETFVKGNGQRARALYKLSKLYADERSENESKVCRETALDLRNLLKPEHRDKPLEDTHFSQLCLWMLW